MGQLRTDIRDIARLSPKGDAAAAAQLPQHLEALERARQLFKAVKAQPDGWQASVGEGARIWSEQATRCRATALREPMVAAGIRRCDRLAAKVAASPQQRYEVVKARRALEAARNLSQEILDCFAKGGLDLTATEAGRAIWASMSYLRLTWKKSVSDLQVLAKIKGTGEQVQDFLDASLRQRMSADLGNLRGRLATFLEGFVSRDDAARFAREITALAQRQISSDTRLYSVERDLVSQLWGSVVNCKSKKRSAMEHDVAPVLKDFFKSHGDALEDVNDSVMAMLHPDDGDALGEDLELLMAFFGEHISPLGVPADAEQTAAIAKKQGVLAEIKREAEIIATQMAVRDPTEELVQALRLRDKPADVQMWSLHADQVAQREALRKRVHGRVAALYAERDPSGLPGFPTLAELQKEMAEAANTQLSQKLMETAIERLKQTRGF